MLLRASRTGCERSLMSSECMPTTHISASLPVSCPPPCSCERAGSAVRDRLSTWTAFLRCAHQHLRYLTVLLYALAASHSCIDRIATTCTSVSKPLDCPFLCSCGRPRIAVRENSRGLHASISATCAFSCMLLLLAFSYCCERSFHMGCIPATRQAASQQQHKLQQPRPS